MGREIVTIIGRSRSCQLEKWRGHPRPMRPSARCEGLSKLTRSGILCYRILLPVNSNLCILLTADSHVGVPSDIHPRPWSRKI